MNPTFQGLAALAENRVIGDGPRIPWHLPEDFKWFKQTTLGHVLVMGRKTFESIGRPLPGRTTIVLTRSGFQHPGVLTAGDLDSLPVAADDPRKIFICGGAEIYALALPRCADLYLTHVKQVAKGDVLFPPYEHLFDKVEELRDTPEFRIVHYRNKALGKTS
ncbi:MAG TPA: dihydrofolate reductase [Roseimicrobium sp.]|nr:dihydrofolate reductase [Roseimicrobium sp.]